MSWKNFAMQNWSYYHPTTVQPNQQENFYYTTEGEYNNNYNQLKTDLNNTGIYYVYYKDINVSKKN